MFKGVLVLKGIFSETAYVCVYLQIKFQVFNIILTSFRQVVILGVSNMLIESMLLVL